MAAARKQVLAGAGAKCVARAEGEAGQGGQENELGASATDCEIPNSIHCLLTLEGPATALLDDRSIHDDKSELDKSGAMPLKPLMLPEFVHTPEPPSPECPSEAGGWDNEHAGEGEEGRGEWQGKAVPVSCIRQGTEGKMGA